MSKWYGQGEQQLSALFEHSAALGGAILFLDELDALAGSRSRELHEASRRMLSVLLRRLDSVESESGAHDALIAATNRPQDLDDALLSRFDTRVLFPAPQPEERAVIFGRYAMQLSTTELASLGKLAEGLTGRDILDVCRQAERSWVCTLLRHEGGDADARFEAKPPPLEQYTRAVRSRQELANVNVTAPASDTHAGEGAG